MALLMTDCRGEPSWVNCTLSEVRILYDEVVWTYLARVSGHSVTQFCNYPTSGPQSLRCKWSELIPIFFVACERKHFTAQSQELDTILFIPPDHLDDVSSICQPQLFHKLLPEFGFGWLLFVRSVLGGMFRLRGVFERMSVVED